MQEDVWKEIKVLLVPSLWYEAWGMVVVEAQLCGIPVISSNVGGLSEAKLDVPYILPVKQLTGEHDENGRYVVDDQDIEPWVETLQTLLSNKEEYESVSEKGRKATAEWLGGMDGSELEKWLEEL
jgi:glycosyltransferase involved in cell wall biosynthesis